MPSHDEGRWRLRGDLAGPSQRENLINFRGTDVGQVVRPQPLDGIVGSGAVRQRFPAKAVTPTAQAVLLLH